MAGKRIIGLVILFCSVYNKMQAQQMVTLQDAIAAALQHNYDILLFSNDSAAAAIDRQYIYGGFLPAINGTAGRTRTTSAQKVQVEGRPESSGSGIQTTNLNAAVSLNWVLFDGLRMFATRDRINQLYDLANIQLKDQVINSTAEVINSYFIIVRQKQQLKAIEEQMSINEERVKLADRKLSVGLGTKPELLQAKVDLNAQKALHLQQQTIMMQAKEQLNQLTGMQLPVSFEVADSIPINDAMDITEIQNNIELTNPGILQALKNLDISNTMLRQAQGARWPSISFLSGYNFTQNNNVNNVNPVSPIFNRNRGFNFGFTATVPLLNYMNVNRSVKQAKNDIAYNEITLAKQKTIVNVSIRIGYNNYRFLLNALKLEEENIQLAKENVFIAMERFKQGVSTFLELREAQKSLEDAYDRLIAARYNTKLAETELLRLKGELVK
ncbi:MAG: TolC family protein [Chitinophagaceae bacterium]|nr:TolC family protein [Chitinophagaceae bacterium]